MEGKKKKVRTIMGGDFNARTGEKGGEVRGEEEEEGRRRSKDKKVNTEGRLLLERIKELGWIIMERGHKRRRGGGMDLHGGKRGVSD